jgi:SAM-dependent methyltransferase
MDLSELQQVWDRLGEDDPFWAVLTDARFKGGRWDQDEFFALGKAEVAGVMATAEARGMRFAREAALDFGCGLGRLTQSLAPLFESVVGVDIAPSMIDRARYLNRFGTKCQYIVNDRSDLTIFPDSSFDLVLSLLVLQHMEPRFSREYISEFVRVVRPGGLVVFQIPSARTEWNDSVVSAVALPEDAYRAELSCPDPPTVLECSSRTAITVVAKNLSEHTWLASTQGLGLAVANHWNDSDGVQTVQDDGRAYLPREIPGGDSVSVDVTVTAPSTPGSYLLEIDMVHEAVAWFAQLGSQTLTLPVTIRLAAPRSLDAATNAPPGPDIAPVMEMNTVSPEEITETVAAARGSVVWIDEHSGAGFHDCTYYVSKQTP